MALDISTSSANAETIPNLVDADHVNTAQVNRTFYACPSGHAKVTIDQSIKIQALLDGGSEVNLMPKRIFDKLDLPIDTDIKWRINSYDSDNENHGPIGVCHAAPIDIGGVEVSQPIFIVEHCNQDLILGRPWERAVRAEYVNEDDGSLTVRVKSPDGRRNPRHRN